MRHKIRIAVAVDSEGSWNASGWGNVIKKESYDQEAMDIAVDGTEDGERRYFIEAEIELPEDSVIVGEVQNT
jgi:hypothetical protein